MFGKCVRIEAMAYGTGCAGPPPSQVTGRERRGLGKTLCFLYSSCIAMHMEAAMLFDLLAVLRALSLSLLASHVWGKSYML